MTTPTPAELRAAVREGAIEGIDIHPSLEAVVWLAADHERLTRENTDLRERNAMLDAHVSDAERAAWHNHVLEEMVIGDMERLEREVEALREALQTAADWLDGPERAWLLAAARGREASDGR